MKNLILLLSLALLTPAASALDRVQLIQSKLHSSLSSILPASDFLIIVNRADTLDDGGASQAVDGSVKQLPGLDLGVDSKGQIVLQGHGANNYSGAVAINVVIENQVRPETYKTIEKLLPDIVGGLRDDDDLKIARGPLRQPASASSNTAPQITIQNSPGQEGAQTQENLKFLALLLITGGIFFWFMSKFNLPGRESEGSGKSGGRGSSQDDAEGKAPQSPEVTAADFALLDAEAVALFLMKEVRDRREKTWARWVKVTPSVHQREVFRYLPAWLLSFFHTMAGKNPLTEQELASLSMGELFNEIALVEQSFKTPEQKKKAFLQWFPAQAIRFVPRKHQRALSEASKRTLWAIRPDLGNLVRADEMMIDQVMGEPSFPEVEACAKELMAWPSTSIEGGEEASADMVTRWIDLINQLTEFSPIDSQIEQARKKLTPNDLQKLLARVAHLRTPFSLSEAERKDWLRAVDPADYYWWTSLTKEKPTWNLKDHLRPMRWAMFSQAEKEAAHTKWSEEEKKKSSERILRGLRALLEQPSRGAERGAA